MGWKQNVKWAVKYTTPAGYVGVLLYDRFGNVISEEISETADGLSDLYNEAINLGAEAIDKIGDVSLDVANAGLDLIEGAGLAIISGAELMFDYGYNKISPHRVETVTALTALTVYLTTAVIVFKKIKGAN